MAKNTDNLGQLRKELKILLFLLARECDNPGRELQDLMREVIEELHEQVSNTLKQEMKLRLVSSNVN